MPRTGRLNIPGGCYHIIGRGLERRCIFHEAADKLDFLKRLGSNLSRSQSQCLAWAVMSNHYHLLIRLGPQPMSKLMAPLLGGFAGCYNRRHQRVGYVFQNRYKSILCDEERYLLELVRYIHLNPLRAGVINALNQLDRYPWTGHSGMLGKGAYSWHLVDEALSRFGEERRAARARYRDFMRAGIGISMKEDFTGGGLIRSTGSWEDIRRLRREHENCVGDERILGDSEFVERALSDDKLRIERKTLRKQQGWTLKVLVRCVCADCGLEELSLSMKARGRQLARAKSLICYWGVVELGLPLREIASELCISQQAASKWVRQGRVRCCAEKIDLDSMA